MALKTIEKKVLLLSEIPKEIELPDFVTNSKALRVECHLDQEDIDENIDKWIMENYPELNDEDSFFIEIDC